jgi:2-alkyl-3-oxoalkanoate reductase
MPARSVALTGGSGFVGSHILRRLVADGWRVKALSRRRDGLAATGGAVTAIAGDLATESALAELVSGVDAVIHCAGLVAARRSRDFRCVNRDGTANLLRAVAASGGSPRVILISSLAAREPQLSPYARSKRDAEDLLRQSDSSLDWLALRPPVVYGPGDRATLPVFRQLARGLFLRPGGHGRFSMLYVEDLAEAAAAVLAQAPAPASGRVMELDDGTVEGYCWDEILAAARRQSGRRIRAISVPRTVQRLAAGFGAAWGLMTGRPPILSAGKLREIAHPDWVCRNDLLGNCISWTPTVAFEEGFARTAAWYKAAGLL